MSFGKLKSARKAREDFSFVKSDPILGSASVTAEASPESLPSESPMQIDEEQSRDSSSTMETNKQAVMQNIVISNGQAPPGTEEYNSPTTSRQVKTKESTKPVNLHGCHTSLPSSLEIRETSRHGRGLYAKAALSAGKSYVAPITGHHETDSK